MAAPTEPLSPLRSLFPNYVNSPRDWPDSDVELFHQCLAKLQTPTWLKDDSVYMSYVAAGGMNHKLPKYEKNKYNEIIMQKGECYCRVEGCIRNKQYHVFTTIRSLRAHLRSIHHLEVEMMQGGAVGCSRKEEIKAWYLTTMFASRCSEESDYDSTSDSGSFSSSE